MTRTSPSSSQGNVRTSPYPQRVRTPTSTPSSSSSGRRTPQAARQSPQAACHPPQAACRTPQAAPRTPRAPSQTPQVARQTPPPARQRARVSLEGSPQADEHRLQLIVQPIIKSTVGQRDTSGKTLEDFVANGATFDAITSRSPPLRGGVSLHYLS
ncbi:hypothetical protein ON010_g19002 [Phytophthora cinnamomi]|nr:hypothetical protein ON010_g19002 [Phytophthora cinnamomi]